MNNSVWLAKAYDQAGREVLKKSYEPALWALAISECDGNEPKAQAAYVKARVAQLLTVMATEAEAKKVQSQREIKLKRETQERSARELASAKSRAQQRDKEIHKRFFEAGKRFRSLMQKMTGG